MAYFKRKFDEELARRQAGNILSDLAPQRTFDNETSFPSMGEPSRPILSSPPRPTDNGIVDSVGRFAGGLLRKALVSEDNQPTALFKGLDAFNKNDATRKVASFGAGAEKGSGVLYARRLVQPELAQDLEQKIAENPKTAFAGEMAGAIAPFSAGSQITGRVAAPVLSKFGTGVAGRIGQAATREALTGLGVGTTLGATDALTSGKSWTDAGQEGLKRGLEYGAGGAVFGGLAEGVGAGINAFRNLPKNLDRTLSQNIDDAMDIYSQEGIFLKPANAPLRQGLTPIRPVAPLETPKLSPALENKAIAQNATSKPPQVTANINSPTNKIEPFRMQNTADQFADMGNMVGKDINAPTNSKMDYKMNTLPDDVESLQKYVDEIQALIKDKTPDQLKLMNVNLQRFAEAQRLLKERKFAANSIMNSQVIPEEMKKDIINKMPEYEPITNKNTWDTAKNKVTTDLKQSMDEWKALDSVKSADDTALGQALMVDAIKKGDVSTANEIAYDLAEKLTKAGQSVQAASILKRLSPEGMLTYVNRTLQRAERDLGDAFKGKLKLTEGEADEINKMMEKIRDMPEGREKDIEFGKLQALVSNKIPPTTKEKLKALQRVNLLFNPKTMVRNVGGNVIFTSLNNIKDTVRAGLDKGVSALLGTERTALIPSLKTQAKGMARGFKNTVEDYKLGIDTSNNNTQFELNPQKTTSPFKSKVFKKADELTRLGLKMGDTPFYQASYDDALRQQMTIKGVKEATPEMKLFAENVAKERTFQDTNKFTEAFDSIRRGLNKAGIKGFGLGDVVLPFTKTPANILKAGVEYSPLNIINTATNAIKLAKEGGSINQFKLVDSLAKTLTGSGLLGAGMWLAQQGVITGKDPEDKDAASFQREQGILPYAIKNGGKYISFDWAQPASIPIAMGADIYNNSKNSKGALESALDGTKGGIGTLFSQSMVQGLQKLFSSYDSSGNGLIDNLEGAGYNAILQLLPFNALSRQVAELSDPTKRSTYEDTGIETNLINKAKASIPGMRNTLPQKFKTTGEADPSRKFLDVLVNPANTGSTKLGKAELELLRLYNESGNNIQFPRIAGKTITPPKNGKTTYEKVTLDGKQRAEYQQKLGTETMNEINNIINGRGYGSMSDAEKASKIQSAITKVDSKVKKDMLKRLTIKPK